MRKTNFIMLLILSSEESKNMKLWCSRVQYQLCKLCDGLNVDPLVLDYIFSVLCLVFMWIWFHDAQFSGQAPTAKAVVEQCGITIGMVLSSLPSYYTVTPWTIHQVCVWSACTDRSRQTVYAPVHCSQFSADQPRANFLRRIHQFLCRNFIGID